MTTHPPPSGAPLLQPLTVPLQGSRLVEASAGTGKTFTIATLVLRLVLGHGGAQSFSRALTPPEILVVTFTDAAAKELRDRIRSRLVQAAAAFEQAPHEVPDRPAGEDVLHDLRAAYAPEQWPAQARTLHLAAQWMDEAAVSTIHSWCQRMLREHAFDSHSLFLQTLQTDERALQEEAVRDWWRHHLYPLNEAQAAQVAGWWATPDALLEDMRQLMRWADTLAEAGEPPAPAQALEHAAQEAARQLAALKEPWAAWAQELGQLLDAAAAQRHLVKGHFRAHALRWLGDLRSWAEDDKRSPFPDKNKAWERLTPQAFWGQWAEGHTPRHEGPEAFAKLRDGLRNLPTARTELLRHAAWWCAKHLAAQKARQAVMGFQDLLVRLDAALRGPNGPALAARIRAQFPVALIDEFQDTDPLQYRIFDTIYGVQRNDSATALMLIGDPKQSIYTFRGADIHTYLTARQHTQGRHATLGTNYRSTQAMVRAVNRVFAQAETATGSAFGYRLPGGENLLPFQEVCAHGRSERWECGAGGVTPALTFWCIEDMQGDMPGAQTEEAATGEEKGEDEELGTQAHRDHMARVCADEMVRLLHAGRAQQAGFVAPDGTRRAVQPGDMAVLVNNGREADAVRRALQQRGLRSVYLSDRSSVYQSPLASELQRWLAACAAPEDERLLRAALATPALAFSWAELDALRQDDTAWEQRVRQCRACHDTWLRHGVLPMLRRWIHEHGIATRLLAQDRERDLTDLLHLAELLQQASTGLDGPQALIRHLVRQRQDEGVDDEGRRVRLESDEQLVKVVTIHKSKGLEYPLVFLPYASACRPAKASDSPPFTWHEGLTSDSPLRLSLSADEAILARVDEERLREDLRKLYVALTRARFATWVGAARVKHLERSALGHLLGLGEPAASADASAAAASTGLRAALHTLAQGHPDIAVVTPSDQRVPTWQAEATATAWREPPTLPARPAEAWGFSSYSALLSRLGSGVPVDSAQAATFLEEATEGGGAAQALPPPEKASTSAGLLHSFPRGASPGSFLHELLEWAGQEGFGHVSAHPADLQAQIERRCRAAGLTEWAPTLQAWMAQWLVTPWDLGGLNPGPRPGPGSGPTPRLTPVRPAELHTLKVEMEFWFPTPEVRLERLDAQVRRHTLGGAARPALSAHTLNGMLKGFIDLVFEHEGRYFVADYKSNWLGAQDADYTPTRMQQAVLDKRYDLQYVLYVFALHRLLRSRLAGYDYERHVGGAVYLFLRGHAAPSQGLHLERPPWALIEALEQMFGGNTP
ncbi:MAG: exodeoxyribonuclease V subunit beta [Betaproteobacteria bacterium]